MLIDFELKKVLLPPPPLGSFADISYLEENFKPHLLRDVCFYIHTIFFFSKKLSIIIMLNIYALDPSQI